MDSETARMVVLIVAAAGTVGAWLAYRFVKDTRESPLPAPPKINPVETVRAIGGGTIGLVGFFIVLLLGLTVLRLVWKLFVFAWS